MFLLAGLFVLIYVMVFAGALIAEVLQFDTSRTAAFYLTRAWHDLIVAAPWATVGSALWIVIAYFFHQAIIDAVTGGHDVSRKDQPRLYNLLENLCISRGIPMPKLKVMDTDAVNAFATGLNRRQYAITVTTGLMNELNDREMEAVLGHELTHIRNGDVQLMVVAVIIAGVVGFVAELFFRIVFNSGARVGGGGWRSSRSSSSGGRSDSKGGGAIVAVIIAVALIALAWFLSQVVRMALSRSRELMADAGSVELTKDADAMISALRKIENRGELPGATSAVMEMCVDNPREGFADLFATHPSIETRVRALVTYAGGHDPGPMQPHNQPERTATDPKLPGGQELPPGPWSEPTPPASATPPAPGPWGNHS